VIQNTTAALTSTLMTTVTDETSTFCSYSANESGMTSLFSSQFPPSLIGDLLGNFTQMSDYFNITSSLGNSSSLIAENINASYSLAGTQVINSTTFTIVNFDIDLSILSTSQNESGTIYFDPAWNSTLVVTSGVNLTGTTANTIGQLYMIFFEVPLVFQSFQAALTTQLPVLHEINQTTATFGNTTLDVTNYNATIANETSTTSACGQSIQTSANGTEILQLAVLPHSNTTVLTSLVYQSTASTENITASSAGIFQVRSLTLAIPSSTTESTTKTTTVTKTTSLTSAM
jgi:hypothetical protein